MNVNEISYMYNSALNGLSVEGTKSVNYEKQIDAAKEALKKAGAEGFSSSLSDSFIPFLKLCTPWPNPFINSGIFFPPKRRSTMAAITANSVVPINNEIE